MNLEEAVELEETILEIQQMYKHLPSKRVRECLLMYVSMRRIYTREDLIQFVKVNIDLNNF